MQMTGAQIVIETLIEQGTEVVFGYPGGTVNDIYDQLYQNKDRIRHILCSHEQGGTHAADGYSRASGKTGVMIATSGPGATNTVTGVATAYMDSIPLVVLTGNVSISVMGQDNFQEVDIMGTTMGIVKHSYRVEKVEELADTIREAFYLAREGRPGPVLIDIPKDVQTAKCEFTQAGVIPYEPAARCTEEEIDAAVKLMEESRRPIIYVGGGAIYAGAEESILKLAQLLDAPISTSLMGVDAVPADTEGYLGMSGMHGHYASTKAISEADLYVAVGARFSDRSVGNKEKYASRARIVHIDVDPAEINKNIDSDVDLIGDANEVLKRIIAKVKGSRKPEWKAEIARMKEYEKKREPYFVGPLTPYGIIDAVCERVPEDTPVVTDVGEHQMWVAQRYRFRRPRTFLTSGGFGTMGFGMGAANGAATATGKRSILFTGDGSFAMNMMELGTAVTENIPVTVIVFNNGTLGMVRELQKFFVNEHYFATTTNRKTDFAALAEAFGAKGFKAATPEEFSEALEGALAAEGPSLIECMISPDELVYPMVPPNKSVDEIMLQEERS